MKTARNAAISLKMGVKHGKRRLKLAKRPWNELVGKNNIENNENGQKRDH